MSHAPKSRRSAVGPKAHAPGPQGPSSSSGGGLPWGKILAGCGCLTVFVMIAGGAAVWFLYQEGSKFIDKQKKEFGVEGVAVPSDEGSGSTEAGAKGKGASKGDIRKRLKKKKDEALDPERIRQYAREPLTRKEVREQRKFIEGWRAHSSYKHWKKQWKEMEEMNKRKDKDSVAGKLRAARQIGKTMQAVKEVMRAYDKYVRKHGGYQKLYGRIVRIGGVVAASKTIADSHKLDDPNTDKVAKLMLKERPEIAKEYQKNIEAARKAAKREKKTGGKNPEDMAAYQGLFTMVQGPGTLALAVMPEKSFKTWKSLSIKERKSVRKDLGESIAPGPWFALTQVNPAALLSMAYLAEVKEFSPK